MSEPTHAAEKGAPRIGWARCPRCRGIETAEIGVPWERHDGTWEWVKVCPHLHVSTGHSTCKPRGYARRVTSPILSDDERCYYDDDCVLIRFHDGPHRPRVTPPAEKDARPYGVRICRTCAHALTDREREDYVDQCEPCVTSPAEGRA